MGSCVEEGTQQADRGSSLWQSQDHTCFPGHGGTQGEVRLKPTDYHPEARWEADDAAAYYHGNAPEAPSRFLTVLGKIIAEIQSAPRRWPFELGTNAQRRQVKGFPYTIFYLNEPDRVIILAVAHTSRRPGYWKSRIAVD